MLPVKQEDLSPNISIRFPQRIAALFFPYDVWQVVLCAAVKHQLLRLLNVYDVTDANL